MNSQTDPVNKANQQLKLTHQASKQPTIYTTNLAINKRNKPTGSTNRTNHSTNKQTKNLNQPTNKQTKPTNLQPNPTSEPANLASHPNNNPKQQTNQQMFLDQRAIVMQSTWLLLSTTKKLNKLRERPQLEAKTCSTRASQRKRTVIWSAWLRRQQELKVRSVPFCFRC